MDFESAKEANRRVYGAMAVAGKPLCRPATDADLRDPLKLVDAAGWLGGSISGKRLLALAAGGGRQSALYAAAGADVTVVDLSPAMLELDRQVAAERNLRLRLIEASMDDLSMFETSEFDLVVQPVSTCYVPSVATVYQQVARVLRPGGLYISQHKTPTSLQCETTTSSSAVSSADGYLLRHAYYRREPIPPPTCDDSTSRRLREFGAVEFLHRWEELVGGLCRSGFAIEDLVEPMHADLDASGRPDAKAGPFARRAGHIAPYVRIKARRSADPASPGRHVEKSRRLILPP